MRILYLIAFIVALGSIILTDMSDVFRNNTVSDKTKNFIGFLEAYLLLSIVISIAITSDNSYTKIKNSDLEEIGYILDALENESESLNDSALTSAYFFDSNSILIEDSMIALDSYFEDSGSKSDAREAYEVLNSMESDFNKAHSNSEKVIDNNDYIYQKVMELKDILEMK